MHFLRFHAYGISNRGGGSFKPDRQLPVGPTNMPALKALQIFDVL